MAITPGFGSSPIGVIRATPTMVAENIIVTNTFYQAQLAGLTLEQAQAQLRINIADPVLLQTELNKLSVARIIQYPYDTRTPHLLAALPEADRAEAISQIDYDKVLVGLVDQTIISGTAYQKSIDVDYALFQTLTKGMSQAKIDSIIAQKVIVLQDDVVNAASMATFDYAKNTDLWAKIDALPEDKRIQAIKNVIRNNVSLLWNESGNRAMSHDWNLNIPNSSGVVSYIHLDGNSTTKYLTLNSLNKALNWLGQPSIVIKSRTTEQLTDDESIQTWVVKGSLAGESLTYYLGTDWNKAMLAILTALGLSDFPIAQDFINTQYGEVTSTEPLYSLVGNVKFIVRESTLDKLAAGLTNVLKVAAIAFTGGAISALVAPISAALGAVGTKYLITPTINKINTAITTEIITANTAVTPVVIPQITTIKFEEPAAPAAPVAAAQAVPQNAAQTAIQAIQSVGQAAVRAVHGSFLDDFFGLINALLSGKTWP